MTFVPRGRIVGVHFHASGTEEIERESVMPIKSYDLYRQNLPLVGGLYDDHLGTTSHEYPCRTCWNNKKDCLGHDGHLKLNQPIIQAIFLEEIKKWLRCCCFNCGNPVMDVTPWLRVPAHSRLDAFSKVTRVGFKSCPICTVEHPAVGKDADRPLMLRATSSTGTVTNLYPVDIEGILTKITDETVQRLGKALDSHPRKFIIRSIKIPPPSIRPDTRKAGSGRSSSDHLTVLLQNIIRRNEKLPTTLPDVISPDLEEAIYGLCDTYYAYVRGSHSKRIITSGDNTPMKSLAGQLKGKGGLFRKHMQGKRVRIVARTTISGDPTLRTDEIGVPVKFAKLLVIEETVQEFNKSRLMICFLNGHKKYPGCSKIIRKRTGTEHNVDGNNMELEVGDVLLRDLMDGDYVYFNRQPSLLPSAITAMRVVVSHDPDVLTIRMNVTVCSLFNADFDGDQMNIFVGSNLASRIEIERHAAVPNFFIKHSNSAPLVGQVDDSIIGSALLTRNSVVFDRYHAMLLFGSVLRVPAEFRGSKFTSRDIVTMHLADTPVNFVGNTEYYNEKMAPYIAYDPADTKVEITNGVHVRGVLDKATIGKGKKNGLYHTISLKYGEKRALEAIYNMQQLAIGYLQQCGFSVGINDVLIGDAALAEIHRIESGIIDKSARLTQQLNDGKIIPPVDQTVEEFYERQQIEHLHVMDDFRKPIFEDVDAATNNFIQMIIYGSKGTVNHYYHISSAIGQIVINDKRPRKQLSFGRTFPHFTRFDMSPQANGFIVSSYISGMNADEFAFNAQNARADFITKVLFTSVTGEAERKSVKNLESLVVSNTRTVNKYNNIVQILYGENGLDSRRVVKCTVPTVMLSDADLEAGWHTVVPDAPVETAAVFEREYAQVVADRNEYRALFMKIEAAKFNEPFVDSKVFATDVKKIAKDVSAMIGPRQPGVVEIGQMVTRVEAFVEWLPYVYLNDAMYTAGVPAPPHMVEAVWLMSVYVRSILNSKQLLYTLDITAVNQICSLIGQRFQRSLIAYGAAVGVIAALSFSEPLTQYMLDAHHRTTTGGTTKSSMVTVKEVLGARSADKLTAPTMVLVPLEHNQSALAHKANHIEVMRFVSFVKRAQVFFEKFGAPQHPDYTHETSIFENFKAANPLMRPPSDLLSWCVRFVIDRAAMIAKNMPLETIVRAIRENYTDTYIVYTEENAPTIILRVYLRTVYFDKHVEADAIEVFRDSVLDTVIRGLSGVKQAVVTKLNRAVIQPDGSITRSTDKYCVVTNGTNLAGAFSLVGFDPYQTTTDAIEEVARVLGIEAARQTLVTSIRNLGAGGLVSQHVSIYADEMTYTGVVTSIERQGLVKREASNVLLRMGFASPIQTLQEAAANSMDDPVQGITSPLLVGDIPLSLGTAYNRFYVNEGLIAQKSIRPDEYLDDLMK